MSVCECVNIFFFFILNSRTFNWVPSVDNPIIIEDDDIIVISDSYSRPDDESEVEWDNNSPLSFHSEDTDVDVESVESPWDMGSFPDQYSPLSFDSEGNYMMPSTWDDLVLPE